MRTADAPSSKVGFPQFVWIWNRGQNLPTPRLHVHMARWLAESWHNDRRELVLLAFRNSGKSTLVGLFCAWLLTVDCNLRILVLAGDFPLARKMARNIRRIVERHPLTLRLKPTRSDDWASDHFTVRRSAELRDPSVLAKGISANVTGLRADICVCDDVEVPNTCDTPQKRTELRTRLQEIEYVLVPGGLQLFVGTPHTYHSIYRSDGADGAEGTRPLLAGFRRLEIPLLDAAGVSQWPERFSQAKIEAIQRRAGPAKFESQMLLRPRNILDGRLDPDRLVSYRAELEYSEANRQPLLHLAGRRLVSASCWWDPSFGSPVKGDANVIAAVFTDSEGRYFLHRVQYLSHQPQQLASVDEATQLCRQVASFARDLYLPSITVETNGIGRFLPGLLRQELRRAGLACAVAEHVSRLNKDVRIIDAFDAVLAAGRLLAHDQVWSTPFIEEMREWRPAIHARDDGLDAVAGCLLGEPVRLPRLILPDYPARRTGWRGVHAIAVNSDFEL
ncbi:MAG: phage terminase large subunit [Rhodospirillales bacterium]